MKVWNRRHEYAADGDAEYPIAGEHDGHLDADAATVGEFLQHLRTGAPTQTSPVAARYAVAVGDLAAQSLRNGSVPLEVPALADDLVRYFEETTVSSSAPDHHQGERHHP